MNIVDLLIDGRHITTEEELHSFLIEQVEKNKYSDKLEIEDEQLYRARRKKKKKDCKPSGPKCVCLKIMYPYKIEVKTGCKQIIFGVLVDSHGHPIHNPIIDFELSNYCIGTLSFSPAISFHDGYFFTTFIGEQPGCGEIKICCKGTDLNKVIYVNVENNDCCY